MRKKEINLLLTKILEKERVSNVLGHARMKLCAEYWRRFVCGQCSAEEYETFLCHDRFCPYCQRYRAIKNAVKVQKFLEVYKPEFGLKFLTLTKKNMKHIEKKDIQNLRRHFKNLRYRLARNGYKIRGGIYSIETTYNSFSGGYHPHIHSLIDVDYISQEKLSRWWLETTGDSFIVDIREANEKSVFEVCKYMSKTWDFPDEQLRHYYEVCKRQRLIQPFKWKLNIDDGQEKTDPGEKVCICGSKMDPDLKMIKISELQEIINMN